MHSYIDTNNDTFDILKIWIEHVSTYTYIGMYVLHANTLTRHTYVCIKIKQKKVLIASEVTPKQFA